jgi:hypothetical protein
LQSVITAAAVYVTAAVFTVSTAAVSTASAVITAAAVYVTAAAFTIIAAAASIIAVTTTAVSTASTASTATAVFTATAVVSVYSASASDRSPHSVSSVRPWSYYLMAPFPQLGTNIWMKTDRVGNDGDQQR